jgi:hypothetical protein
METSTAPETTSPLIRRVIVARNGITGINTSVEPCTLADVQAAFGPWAEYAVDATGVCLVDIYAMEKHR